MGIAHLHRPPRPSGSGSPATFMSSASSADSTAQRSLPTARPTVISRTRLLSEAVDRMTGLLHHPGGLAPQVLGVRSSAELPVTGSEPAPRSCRRQSP